MAKMQYLKVMYDFIDDGKGDLMLIIEAPEGRADDDKAKIVYDSAMNEALLYRNNEQIIQLPLVSDEAREMLLDGRAILLVTEMNGDDISDVYEAELELNKISAENKKVEIEDDLYPLDDLNDDPNKAGERVRRMLQNDPKEVKRVVQFYTDMANDGNAGAQYELANFYLEGLGVEKDEAKAKEWLQKAAKQGHQAAIELLENKIGK